MLDSVYNLIMPLVRLSLLSAQFESNAITMIT